MPRKRTTQWVAGEDVSRENTPSRSAKKRQSHAQQALGEALIGLSPARLDSLGLPEELREALALHARIRDREGQRRQRQFIGRLMRDMDSETLRNKLALGEAASARQATMLHQAEQWRERLLAAAQDERESLARSMVGQATGDARSAATRQAVEELCRLAREASPGAAAGGSASPRARGAYRALFRALVALLTPRADSHA